MVDDNEVRAKRISIALCETHNIESYQIEHVISIQKARECIRKISYTAVFLDMALPNYDNDKKIDDWGGIKVLKDITSGRGQRPSKIFGFTALDSNVSDKQREFQDIGFSLYYSEQSDLSWLNAVTPQLDYVIQSSLSPIKIQKDLVVLTVHGIRTFGSWQKRLHVLVNDSLEERNVEHLEFKYANIDPITFASSSRRNKVVGKLSEDLRQWLKENRANEIICVAHSFGTYTLMKSLENQDKQDLANISKIILAGTVLSEDYDFSELNSKSNIRIYNQCAINDIPLLLSKAFVTGTGMAGKVGFRGMTPNVQNKFYAGGHSVFFDSNNEFMSKNWLPLITLNTNFDEKIENAQFATAQEIMTNAARLLSNLKGYYFRLFIIISALTIFYLLLK
ncbi:response regulator receiver protein, putative [Aliivibrio fischeri MJ11]|uniref:Response regulator receiver protein, putative n=1 Tax=Aliivibrio fischeri (strain MJ11) TaxID=388396 RepID=B5FF43_ALIFM|nr:response regulator receiver protein [Aliivibrio fischeri]ACH65323.1 response regulator receiver protein, putative [Aliivibrio fischeri MJ11]